MSSHFGTAQYYDVCHNNSDPRYVHSRRSNGENRHGRGASSAYDKYRPIQDCQVLITGGMGENAYQHAQSFRFQVIFKGGKIKDAVEAYLKGNLENDMRRLHK